MRGKEITRLYGGWRGHRLSPMARLGLAYCRLEGLVWDEAVGPKPKGFDEAPDSIKHFVVQRPMRQLEAMLGETYLDRCRWVYDQRKSEKSWIEFQMRRWEQGDLTLGYRRNDVTHDRGSGLKLTF